MTSEKLKLGELVEILIKLCGYYLLLKNTIGLLFYGLALFANSGQSNFYMSSSSQLFMGIILGGLFVFYHAPIAQKIVGQYHPHQIKEFKLDHSILLVGVLLLFLGSIHDLFSQINIYLTLNPQEIAIQRQAYMEAMAMGEPIKPPEGNKSSAGVFVALFQLITYALLIFNFDSFYQALFNRKKSSPPKEMRYMGEKK